MRWQLTTLHSGLLVQVNQVRNCKIRSVKKRNMKQAHIGKLFGAIAGTLIAGSGLQAQIVPPIDPVGPPTPLPSFGILATDPTALEGTSSGAFTLIRYGPATNDLVVSLAISGTASNGVDYELITNGVPLKTNVVILPTGFLAVDILVQPILDTINRGNKTVVLGVETSNVALPMIPASRHATVTIVDDVFNIPAPTVEITAPTNDSTFWFGTPITLTASASDTGANLRSVSFFDGDDLLGKATTSPYSYVWTDARPGRHTLTALAFDVVNQSTLSAPVQIFVTNVVPVIVLSSPTNGSNFVLTQPVTLEADSSDAVNPITNVTFYANGHVLDSIAIPTSATSPYTNTYTWTPANKRAVYFLQASATDTLGSKTYSKQVMINVSKP